MADAVKILLMDFNPLWILVGLTVLGLAVKGLFWLRDVHIAKEGWSKFTTETFPAFADEIREIRGRIDQLFERIPQPKTLSTASPVSLNELGRRVAESLDTQTWAARVAPTLTNEIAGKRPFEIDQFCEEYVGTRIDDQLGERVSACAYDFGLPRYAVLAVLRVELRDELIRLAGQA